MKSNNLESIIKKALDERSILPTKNSWDRLDTMLSLAEVKKPKRTFGWLYIAASFIGIFLVVAVFFNRGKQLIEPTNSIVIENNTPKIPSENIIEKGVETQQKITTPSNYSLAITNKKSDENSSTINPKTENVSIDNQIENTQHDKYITQNTSLKSVTDIKIHELLTDAQSSLKNETISAIKINPLALLNQVDEPVLLTFKDKALHAISENYKTIQTAVSNRNQ